MGIKNILYRRGFTLLEVMIVLSIFALIVPAMFSMYFMSLRAQHKVLVLRDAKRNGDNALTAMENLIKQNAVTIHFASPPSTANQVCTSAVPSSFGVELFFADKDNTWFTFSEDNGKIASTSGSLGGSVDTYLTNAKSIISDFDVGCVYVSETSPPLVSITFDVDQAGPTGRPEDVSSLTYQTKVKLRSY